MGVSNETQERIIACAIKIFAEKGYNGSTTSEIAKAAGVAEGTVFKYYTTKKKLLSAVLDKIVHELIPQIANLELEDLLKACSEGDTQKAIKALIISKISQINEQISAFRILISELQYHNDLKDEYVNKFVPGIISKIEEVLNRGIVSGSLRNVNLHIAARCFISMLIFTVLEKNVLRKDLDFDKEIDIVLDIFYNGVGKKENI